MPGRKYIVPPYYVITLPRLAALMAFGVALPLYLLVLHLLTGWALLGYVVFSTHARYAAPARTTPTVLTTT